jgi:histidinol-phosphate aminotransferase
MIQELVRERESLVKELVQLPMVQQVFPSDANFILVQVPDANGLYNYLVDQGIIVRNRSNVILCEGCLRITIGTEMENQELVAQLKQFSSKAA